MENPEYLLNKYKFERRPQPLEQGILEAIPFQLPEDYKFYLENYEPFEGPIGSEYVQFWKADELLEINKGYDITEYLPDVFGIGSNGGGEFIGIEFLSDGTHRIILSDLISMETEYFIEIGTSFFDMLVRLDNGREWFE
ncbi:SMI1/KNR4 family protein [Mucilaginibacter sp. SMC90]|uniref:SMI1/KNR4 family protein n=1 Tax=Mucilaginibacter sp. SMC90 TaxID=2929803 RepID=UPI001FB4F484|nr:SMI1/KNR4 family protein [Mucilaginibacter sp. SMC90]UOE50578.1 SMI1/KNR4 family protein [Mucilaginibacter sp. SMC90]